MLNLANRPPMTDEDADGPAALVLALALALGVMSSGCARDGGAGSTRLGTGAVRDASTDGETTSTLPDGGLAVLGASSPEACAVQAQYRCSPNMAQSNACYCNLAAPIGPSDCPASEQFQCAAYLPEFRSCRCDASAPASADDCPSGVISCESTIPRYGCQCAELAEP